MDDILGYDNFQFVQEKILTPLNLTNTFASLKEVKLRPRTDDHDLAFKLKNAKRFLMDGDKVKVTVMYRGRAIPLVWRVIEHGSAAVSHEA